MKKIVKLILWSVLFIGVAMAGYRYWQQKLDQPLSISTKNSIFVIRKGVPLRYVLKELRSKNIISNLYPVLFYIKWHQLGSKIQAGEYALYPGINSKELIALFISGKTITHQFRIIEGWTYQQVISRLDRLKNISHKISSDQYVIKKLNIHHPSMEGLLFPDTYDYKKGDSDISIVRRAHNNLIAILKNEWKKRAKNLPFKNSYQALILASIVEKETGMPSERSKVAGVFVRRLQKNMRLQTDPSTIYGLGKSFNGNLTKADLAKVTPYNTYRVKGLPPTPIAFAGRGAIHAALHPDKSHYLYFVAKGDGTHFFSNTFSEHRAAVRKFQILHRAKNYRSVPIK